MCCAEANTLSHKEFLASREAITMTESGEPLSLTEDDDLPVSITHSRDTIIFDGKVEQDYRFLNYRFKGRDGDIIARMYLDDPWIVSIVEPMNCEPLDAHILAYLQSRFNEIRCFGGPDGYIDMWVKPKRGGTVP
jgi:hypothetical protein